MLINDLDVFILDGLNPDQCIAGDDTSVNYADAPAGSYYVVVDGRYGVNGNYPLNVSCY